MASFLLRMPAGIPGAVTRQEQSTVEPQSYDTAAPFPAYGVPAKVGANGKMQPIGAGDTPASVYGLLVRPYPTNSSQSGLGVAVPSMGGVCNILRRGYMTVLLNGAAAAVKNAPVFVRIAGAAAGKPIGGIEAAADATAGNTIQALGFVFMGSADAQGNVEVAFNI